MSPRRSRILVEKVIPREELAREIARLIERRQISQAETARIVNDAPSQISTLLGGELDGFSAERLIRWLTRLGTNVDIVLQPNSHGGGGQVRVRRRE